MNLKLEVDCLTVEIAARAGDSQRATFFIPVPDRVTSPASSLAAELNDPAIVFLPCRIGDRTSLIQVDWIVHVRLDSALVDWPAIEEAGAVSSRVELELATGERLAGDLLMEGPEYARRVSDYLNRSPNRFVLLRQGGAALYVNRRAVARIDLQEGA